MFWVMGSGCVFLGNSLSQMGGGRGCLVCVEMLIADN